MGPFNFVSFLAVAVSFNRRATYFSRCASSVQLNSKLRRQCGGLAACTAAPRTPSSLEEFLRLFNRPRRARTVMSTHGKSGTDGGTASKKAAPIDRSTDRATDSDSLISADLANAFCESANCACVMRAPST